MYFDDIFSFLRKVANSVWIEPARSDWGWGLLFSLRRIYAAFGEHPAAGGMYMFFGFLGPCGTL